MRLIKNNGVLRKSKMGSRKGKREDSEKRDMHVQRDGATVFDAEQ